MKRVVIPPLLISNPAVYTWDALREAGPAEYWCGQKYIGAHSSFPTPLAAYRIVKQRIVDDIGLPTLLEWKLLYADFIVPDLLTADNRAKAWGLVCWKAFWGSVASSYSPIDILHDMRLFKERDFYKHLISLELPELKARAFARIMVRVMLMQFLQATYIHVYQAMRENPGKRFPLGAFADTPVPVVLATKKGRRVLLQWIHQKTLSVAGRRIFC